METKATTKIDNDVWFEVFKFWKMQRKVPMQRVDKYQRKDRNGNFLLKKPALVWDSKTKGTKFNNQEMQVIKESFIKNGKEKLAKMGIGKGK